MNQGNSSSRDEFLLLGFSIFEMRPTLLFLIFSLLYGTILAFNITIMSAILLDQTLHMPMYFLLFALAASETCTTLVTIPRLLVSLLSGSPSISFAGCALQMLCFFGFSANNCFLLVAMAYDRYVAICYPLQYRMQMNNRVCAQLATTSFTLGFLISTIIVNLVFRLPFCGPNGIRHFFCDLAPVLSLACSDTYQSNIGILVLSAIVLLGTVTLIFLSYIYILSAILQIHSSTGRWKAFSTCASHLTVVITHFGCAFFVYLKPRSDSSLDADTLISVVYVFLTPLFNPVIYTLRNKEVKLAIKKLQRHSFCPKHSDQKSQWHFCN
ncbi:olfactory receptor 10T2-like [Tiliqua scincoides]|uniref:olfactory receptor 10T2-like n=1 Tax=Tiliqua scincoides TaxID=71010 RepID=UPI003462354A